MEVRAMWLKKDLSHYWWRALFQRWRDEGGIFKQNCKIVTIV